MFAGISTTRPGFNFPLTAAPVGQQRISYWPIHPIRSATASRSDSPKPPLTRLHPEQKPHTTRFSSHLPPPKLDPIHPQLALCSAARLVSHHPVVMPPHSSAGMRSNRCKLQRRRAKLLAPTRPASKKPSTLLLPSCESARNTVREPRPRPRRDQDPSLTISESQGSAGTPGATAHLKPGTAVLVSTRTEMMVMGKHIVLWLPAAVVLAADDGGYEVIYEGKLPRWDPYSTVYVARDHVRPQMPSATTPPLSSAAGSCASTSKNSEMQPTPSRPTTAGKSVRLVRKLFPELERQARAILPG